MLLMGGEEGGDSNAQACVNRPGRSTGPRIETSACGDSVDRWNNTSGADFFHTTDLKMVKKCTHCPFKYGSFSCTHWKTSGY